MPDPVDETAAKAANLSIEGNTNPPNNNKRNPSPAEVASLLSSISPDVYARIEAFQNKRSAKARAASAVNGAGGATGTGTGQAPLPELKTPPPGYKAAIPNYPHGHSQTLSPGHSPGLPQSPSPFGPALSQFSGPIYNTKPPVPSSQPPVSLSARRGLKLGSPGGPPLSPPATPCLSHTAPPTARNSPAAPNPPGGLSSKRPGFKLDIGAINSSTASQAASAQLLANPSIANYQPKPSNPPNPPSPSNPSTNPAHPLRHPQPNPSPSPHSRPKPSLSLGIGSKPENLFSGHSKYIDVNSGHLNFSGKASLHSKGIDFSSGSKFRISLDELEPLGELGRGNYGTVTKVRHKPTGIIMAMKEIRLELEEAKFLQIIMELEILHKCVSPYIVDFYGAFFVEGAVYLCMEYMDGGSLDKIYEDGVDEPYLAVITDSVVRGLKQLKDQHNIIHRDVKPTNILVSTSGKVKLCDFGVSGNLVASIAKTNIGCQSYMAPERIKSANPDDVLTYNVQSDIWSLGLSVLEVAKGCYPYPPETYRNLFSQLSAIIHGETPTLPADRFSEDAQSFVADCLNKNPMLRPTYAKLLNHPWIKKLAATSGTAEEKEEEKRRLGEFVKRALEKKQSREEERKKKSSGGEADGAKPSAGTRSEPVPKTGM